MSFEDPQVISLLQDFKSYAQREEFNTDGDSKAMLEEDLEDGLDEKDRLEKKEFEDQLALFEPIDRELALLKEVVRELKEAKVEMNDVTEEKRRAAIISGVDKMLKRARKASMSIKKKLTGQVKSSVEASKQKFQKENVQGAIEPMIMQNFYNLYMRRFFVEQGNYMRLALSFKDTVNERTRRDLMYVDQNLSEKKADELIESGAAQQYLQQKIEGSNPQYEEIMAKSEAVKQIKAEVTELLNMFLEMQSLVQQQQDTVDSICMNIANAKEFTGEAVVELHKAADYKLAADKQKIICGIIALVVLAVIIIIIIAATGGFKKDG